MPEAPLRAPAKAIPIAAAFSGRLGHRVTLPLLCATGVLLGVAERVPGLSAAGAALLLGAFPPLVACLVRDRGEARAPHLPGSLLRWLALVAGLAAGMALGGALAVGTLAIRSPVAAAALLGIAVCAGSVFYLRRGSASYWRLPLLAIGAMLGFGMNIAEPTQDVPHFLPGLIDAAVAAATALVPGIGLERAAIVSGAHACALALLAGGADWRLALFGLVSVAGFTVFGQGLLRTWARFPVATEALLLGALLGGLVRLWPWQLVSAYTLGPSGSQLAIGARAVTPATWAAYTGQDPSLLAAIMALLVGLLGTGLLGTGLLLFRTSGASAGAGRPPGGRASGARTPAVPAEGSAP